MVVTSIVDDKGILLMEVGLKAHNASEILMHHVATTI